MKITADFEIDEIYILKGLINIKLDEYRKIRKKEIKLNMDTTGIDIEINKLNRILEKININNISL